MFKNRNKFDCHFFSESPYKLAFAAAGSQFYNRDESEVKSIMYIKFLLAVLICEISIVGNTEVKKNTIDLGETD